MSSVTLVLRSDEANKKLLEEASRALNDAASSMAGLAQQLAPVDTGYMRDHILQTQEATESNLESIVESQADYSLYVEFGTVNMDAQPFFTPAFESAKRQLDKVKVF
jgi:HK97 gp10 family phage protein